LNECKENRNYFPVRVTCTACTVPHAGIQTCLSDEIIFPACFGWNADREIHEIRKQADNHHYAKY
jgi:hypothetical protein